VSRRSMPAVPEYMEKINEVADQLTAFVREGDAKVLALIEKLTRLEDRIDGALMTPVAAQGTTGTDDAEPAFGGQWSPATREARKRETRPVLPEPPRFTYDEVLAAICPWCEDKLPDLHLDILQRWEHSNGQICFANAWRRSHPR
jgi:hypothetical protein